MPGREIFVAPNSETRLFRAAEFVRRHPAGTEILVLGATRQAAADFIRERCANAAMFGLQPQTPQRVAAAIAAPALAAGGLAPAGALACGAAAARAASEALRSGALGYFAPVVATPGFARALATTIGELRAAGIENEQLRQSGPAGADLAVLVEQYLRCLEGAATVDPWRIAEIAAATLAGPQLSAVPKVLVFLDVALRSRAESRFAAALLAYSDAALVVVPSGDTRSIHAWESIGSKVVQLESDVPDSAAPSGSLARLRTLLFGSEDIGEQPTDESVAFFSAPGEARECVEVVRRVVDAARCGTPYDEMAVLLRAPEAYAGYLADALRRANVPGYFARGTHRPDPAGRAFLALLDFRLSRFSAAQFCEYLGFARVPAEGGGWTPPEEESFAIVADGQDVKDAEDVQENVKEDDQTTSEAMSPSRWTIRPWRWERLIRDAAIFGGAARWRERIAASQCEITLRLARIRRDEGDSPVVARLESDRSDLEGLGGFVFPLLDKLESWPAESTWAGWIDRLTRLAPRVVGDAQRVLAVLAELAPLGPVSGVSLAEVREVLAQRLSDLREEPPAHRYGRLFVGTPDQVRGRSFSVVFVPGLAERVFPQRPREDALLLDAMRSRLSPDLETQADRGGDERLLLRLAVGAARQRIVFSYPRIDAREGRPRVPSFYGLEVVRASEGRIPALDTLERNAAGAGDARMAWPAPADPARAIDGAEYDLAILEPLLRRAGEKDVAGRARFLIDLNPHLGRSLRARWCRWESRRWYAADGLCDAPDSTRQKMAAHRLDRRAYSASALQQFAACPYKFFLSAIAALPARPQNAAVERLDPRTRGSLFHAVQAATMRELDARGLLPLEESRLDEAGEVLSAIVAREQERTGAEIAPAVPRVWQDEIDSLSADLRGWLQRVARRGKAWQPVHFELAFGLADPATRDPASSPDAVRVSGARLLRGAIDVVERSQSGEQWRIVDYKSGANRSLPGSVVGGGEMLQPVLYAMAFEGLSGKTVDESRLWFCTAAGGYAEHVVRLDERNRRRIAEVLDIIDRAVEHAHFAPAPRDKACTRCDFREVCGPYEELRWKRKDPRPLEELRMLRAFP